MPLLFKPYFLQGLLVTLASSRYVNLKLIEEFSKSSLENIERYEKLPSGSTSAAKRIVNSKVFVVFGFMMLHIAVSKTKEPIVSQRLYTKV